MIKDDGENERFELIDISKLKKIEE